MIAVESSTHLLFLATEFAECAAVESLPTSIITGAPPTPAVFRWGQSAGITLRTAFWREMSFLPSLRPSHPMARGSGGSHETHLDRSRGDCSLRRRRAPQRSRPRAELATMGAESP